MKDVLKKYCDKRCTEFDQISDERKSTLSKVAAYLKYKEDEPINLLFVSSQNSRRSLLGQIWAKVASRYFDFTNVETYSGGTDVTYFNGNLEFALMYIGFDMKVTGDNENAIHQMVFDKSENPSVCFSKLFDDVSNPRENFGVIVMCSAADKNCPYIDGSELRVLLPYINPQKNDGTDKQMESYLNISKKIATEMLYLFSISRSN